MTDLIFDGISTLLGWIEGQTNIMSFSVNSDTTDTIYTNLQNVNLLTIDPHDGYVNLWCLWELQPFEFKKY